MSIINKIIKSVGRATKQVCLYQSPEQLNRIADNADFPCAMFFLLSNGQLSEGLNNIRERVTVAMFFVDKTEFDFAALENERIIERCKGRAARWIRSLVGSHDLRLVNIEGTERVYDYFDVQLTGWAVRLTLEELHGVCSRQD